ncbi:MAG: deoxyribodipyrimidine photo-lyase [SAR86 cluster bacterium]|jgi:deoxyribodipyrimidine photo-lyase|nr:deoxyribodipyrimidine photo-lyase [SAR86 cluster bacterium]
MKTSNNQVSIHWFRQDLRLLDNPALFSAVQSGRVLPIYILDDVNSGDHKMGSASRWWLYKSLTNLNLSLSNNLEFYKGNPQIILNELISKYHVKEIFWNRCYEPWRIKRDAELKHILEQQDVLVRTFNGSLLWEPWKILKKDGSPYKVFTPFYKKGCLYAKVPRTPLPCASIDSLVADKDNQITIDDLDLLPKIKWYQDMEKLWEPGEKGAKNKINTFISEGLSEYKEGRNFPSKKNVSQLSPHLHFGEVSPNQIWYDARSQESKHGIEDSLNHFLSELGWREFSYNLLYHFPKLPTENLQKKFDNFPWTANGEFINRWKKGLTGYPIVDAGMRELWKTGYMHNRIRMVVGSFLVKNLLLHWHEGERWFWDCLIDADLASNSASWQWIGGCGADAAPYFRIFNPVTQGLKFDAEGEYTKKYIPELEAMPIEFLFNPWEAPKDILEEANIVLGKDYPEPIVDLKESREKALEAFKSIKVN